MNTNKFMEFFDPETVKATVHIVGCGAIGSHVAEQLARMGMSNIHLWDFDKVDEHNIANQMFIEDDIGEEKVLAVRAMMCDINPDLEAEDAIHIHNKGWKDEKLNGYIFLCVDDIDLRRAIVKANQYNPKCIGFFDFRMRLTDAQHYAAMRDDEKQMAKLLASMDFTHEEAKDATPKSACGTSLSVVYTVKAITALGVSNFVRQIHSGSVKDTILIDMNLLTLDAFPLK